MNDGGREKLSYISKNVHLMITLFVVTRWIVEYVCYLLRAVVCVDGGSTIVCFDARVYCRGARTECDVCMWILSGTTVVQHIEILKILVFAQTRADFTATVNFYRVWFIWWLMPDYLSRTFSIIVLSIISYRCEGDLRFQKFFS